MPKPELESGKSETTRSLDKLYATGSGALKLALKHSPERVRRASEDVAIRRMLRSPGFDVSLLDKLEDIQIAIDFEEAIWREEQYDDPEDYDYKPYIPQSRTFSAYNSAGEIVGITRLFEGSPLLPPFLTKMNINDPVLFERLAAEASEYKAEEFGTVAVKKELRGGRIFMDLCRKAWRDACERNIQTWGIIMEPERVKKMNQGLGFTFTQIGPTKKYQGGDCAAHIMDFDEVRAYMRATKPELYDWFVNQPL